MIIIIMIIMKGTCRGGLLGQRGREVAEVAVQACARPLSSNDREPNPKATFGRTEPLSSSMMFLDTRPF